jgi:hypothetical protein
MKARKKRACVKVKKKRLKELLASCAVANMTVPRAWNFELRALIKEVLKHRKRRKKLRELQEYVESGDFCEDGVGKRYGYIGDEAVTAILGHEFVGQLNEKL